MANMLKTGLAFLTEQLLTHAADPITYARGFDSVDIDAMYDRKLLKVSDLSGGLRIEFTDMSFKIRAADLVLSGCLKTPERGDLIHVPVNENVETFEVLPFGDEPCWRWLDPFHYGLIVHTKHVDTEQWS